MDTDKQPKLFSLLVYGCQMNFSDSERLAGLLKDMGYAETKELAAADLILLNTCCVRESAENKIYGKIGELKRLKAQKPRLVIGVCGCMAQKDGAVILAKAPHVDFVLGTNKLPELEKLVKAAEREQRTVTLSESEYEIHEGIPARRAAGLAAWVPIMYGCDNFCTYCIVPYVRGRERSRKLANVVAEVRGLAGEGFKEVTLLGQNVNSYGKDKGETDFAELLQAVDAVDGIERVRYMTSHPRDLSDKVIEVIAGSRHICEHFHLPVQHGSDSILRAMNRGYTVDYYRELVAKIRRAVPNASITTDLIVGFPGETPEDFARLLEFMREIRYDAAYTFLYSKRSGTPAAGMEGQVPTDVKKARLQELMDVQNEISLAINKQLTGRTVEVLVEGTSKNDDTVLTGRTRSNKIVLWPRRGGERAGSLQNIKITQAQTWVLKGEPV